VIEWLQLTGIFFVFVVALLFIESGIAMALVLWLLQRVRCRRGRHGSTDPNGICGCCGKKYRLGRMDDMIEGCATVWGER